MKRETNKWTLGKCLKPIMNKSNRFNEKYLSYYPREFLAERNQ